MLQNRSTYFVVFLSGVCFTLLGFFALITLNKEAPAMAQETNDKEILYWYDPMVPDQKFDKPGKSPFMDMQLMPKYATDEKNEGVSISPNVQQNLGIRLTKVKYEKITSVINAFARIQADERKITVLQTKVNGFIEHLYVRAVGDVVRRGQPVADIYSPDLLAAQQELISLHQINRLPGIDVMRTNARERVRLLGMASMDIDEIIKTGRSKENITLYAPHSGTVQELGVREGATVGPGVALMQLADLSSIWVIAEIFERNLEELRVGDAVTINLAAFPNESLSGRVNYIYPEIDLKTRTAKVRIVLANNNKKLKPGMLAKARISTSTHEGIFAPSEAIIATEGRKVVLIKDADSFRQVEVEVGVEINNRTQIISGLNAEENVVISGQFLIDSEASLKTSMNRLTLQPNESNISSLDNVAGQQTHHGTGEITEIDLASQQVTIDHGPIASLQWPAMKMTFKVTEEKMLLKLNKNDKVEFEITSPSDNKTYALSHIKKTNPK